MATDAQALQKRIDALRVAGLPDDAPVIVRLLKLLAQAQT